MNVYLNDGNRPLDGVPRHLQARRQYELLNDWQSTFGVTVNSIHGEGVLECDISASDPSRVFQFLEHVGAVAVDIRPNDLQILMGRSVTAYAASDWLAGASGEELIPYCRVPVDRIMDTIQNLAHAIINGSNATHEREQEMLENPNLSPEYRQDLAGTLAVRDAIMMNKLRAAGFDVPDQIDLDPQPEPEQELPEEWRGSTSRTIAQPWRFED